MNTETACKEDAFSRMSVEELMAEYKATGSEDCKWAIVLRYEGLIKSVAQQVRGIYDYFAQVDDIIDEGIITLLSAIDRFDPDRGVKFETFIAKRIRGMVIDVARKQDWLPRNFRKRAKEINQVVAQLYADLGRTPTEAETAERLGISIERYRKECADVALGNVLSLDALMDINEQTGWYEPAAEGMSERPEHILEEKELHEVLALGVQGLSEKEQLVLSLFYERNLRMKEIAQIMEISPPRVSQIHARAIEKLQTHMKSYME